MATMLTRRFRPLLAVLPALAAVALASCGDGNRLPVLPAEPRSSLGDPIGEVAGGGIGGLLSCAPMSFDSVSQVVGPAGGVISVGAYSLTIPGEALDDDVTITAVAPSGTVNLVRFEPSGLVFKKSASLSMSYANCSLLGILLPPRIAYVTGPSLDIDSYLKSATDLLSLRVTGKLKHFSDYAVAW